jgi:hypothetical protein
MGEGHNAAATALTEAIEECWPQCTVHKLDTMELRGVRFARAARWAYGFQLSALPWSYEAFYDGLSRSQRFADLARASVGAFFGRRLGKAVASNDPDLVISTYPFGSAALDWLRAKRGYSTLTVTSIRCGLTAASTSILLCTTRPLPMPCCPVSTRRCGWARHRCGRASAT